MYRSSKIPLELDRLSKIGEVAVAYYNQIPFNPTKVEYDLWIESLHEPMKSDFRKKGLRNCMGHLNFIRFVFELHDKSMDDFMKSSLSKEDYEFWKIG
jgi:hypothetical protein